MAKRTSDAGSRGSGPDGPHPGERPVAIAHVAIAHVTIPHVTDTAHHPDGHTDRADWHRYETKQQRGAQGVSPKFLRARGRHGG